MSSESSVLGGTVLVPGTTALVTGATGFTGSVLVRELLSLGVKVRAIARPSSDISPFKDLDIEWVRAQVFDEEPLSKAVQNVEFIFHLAAAYREAKGSYEDYQKVHVFSTQLLAKAAVKNPSFKRFIHVSTVGVHGHIENPPASEDYPFNPGDSYQKTKAEAELGLREFAEKHSLPYTVLRPAAIYGPGDQRLLKIFKMASKPLFPILGKTKGLYHLIHVEDLVNAIILAASKPSALGEAFIVGNEHCLSLENIGKIIASAMNRKNRVIRFPAWPFFLAADCLETLCRPFGWNPPLYRRRVAFFTKDRSFNTEKLRTVLGYHPKFSNEEGLKETALWYLKQGWISA